MADWIPPEAQASAGSWVPPEARKPEGTVEHYGKEVLKGAVGTLAAAADIATGIPKTIASSVAAPLMSAFGGMEPGKARETAQQKAEEYIGTPSKGLEQLGVPKEYVTESAPYKASMKPFEALGEGIKYVGKKGEEATGIKAGAIEQTADLLLMAGIPGLPKAKNAVMDVLTKASEKDVAKIRKDVEAGKVSPELQGLVQESKTRAQNKAQADQMLREFQQADVQKTAAMAPEAQGELPFSTSIEDVAARRAAESQQKDLFAGGPDTTPEPSKIGERVGTRSKTEEPKQLELTAGGKLREEKVAPVEPVKEPVNNLQSAVDKLSAGKAFDLTSEEKISWNKAKSAVEAFEPQFEKLSDRQIAERAMDRQWVQDAVDKAKQMDQMYAQIAERATKASEKADMLKKREQMQDHLEALEEFMMREPTEKVGQGKKTLQARYDDILANQVKNAGIPGDAQNIILMRTFNPVEAATTAWKLAEPLREKAKEVFDKYGEEAARVFIDTYQNQGKEGEVAKEARADAKNWTESVEGMVRQNLRNVRAEQRLAFVESERIKELVPEEADRERIAEAVDAGTIDALTGKDREVADLYKEKTKEIGEKAVKAGVLEGLREDYVTHIVDWKKSKVEDFLSEILGRADSYTSGASPKSRFAKGRKYDTFEALNEAIKDSGLELKTRDLAEIYKEYATSMNKAIENKNLITSLKDMTDYAGDAPIRKITDDSPMPRGWQTINSGQFRGYAVHPDIAPALKHVLDSREHGAIFNAIYNLSQATKRVNVIGSLFHAKSLGEASLFAGKTPFAGSAKALEQYKKGGLGDSVDKWIREGLILEMPEDVSNGILQTVSKAADSLIAKFAPKDLQVFNKTIGAFERQVQGRMDKITWDYGHTGQKIALAEKYLESARMKNPNASEAQLRQEIARFVNNSFGGLDWFDVATQFDKGIISKLPFKGEEAGKYAKQVAMQAMSPEGRKWMQILMFAPDWTISTLRAFTSALPKSLDLAEGLKGLRNPKTQADFARLYQLRTAIIMMTAGNAINMMTSGHPLWENKDPSRVEFEDGTSMQLAKHAMEPYHWIHDFDKTLGNKLGFIPRAAATYITGVEYASPGAPKLVDPTVANRAKAALGGALPFQVSGYTGAPEGEGLKRAVAGTLGVPIYGQTKDQQRAASRQKRKELKDLLQRRRQERGY